MYILTSNRSSRHGENRVTNRVLVKECAFSSCEQYTFWTGENEVEKLWEELGKWGQAKMTNRLSVNMCISHPHEIHEICTFIHRGFPQWGELLVREMGKTE